MNVLNTALVAVGGLMLTHAIYSSYEHSFLAPTTSSSLLASNSTISSPKSISTHPPLPLDIILEALISTLLLTIAIVSSAPALRPIRWSEWAGRIEREGWDPHAETYAKGGVRGINIHASASSKGRGGVGNPYKGLEERRGFSDLRAQRKAFADYIRDGAAT